MYTSISGVSGGSINGPKYFIDARLYLRGAVSASIDIRTPLPDDKHYRSIRLSKRPTLAHTVCSGRHVDPTADPRTENKHNNRVRPTKY